MTEGCFDVTLYMHMQSMSMTSLGMGGTVVLCGERTHSACNLGEVICCKMGRATWFLRDVGLSLDCIFRSLGVDGAVCWRLDFLIWGPPEQ